MSNSASVKGGATLFFTIFTRVRLPVTTPSGLLDRADAADVHAHAGVKLQRFPAGRCLRIAEHDADLFPNLICENAAGARLRNERSEFPERRAHQARLRANRDIADLAFEFCFGHERGDGIEDNHIERIGTHERFANAQRFFPGTWLRDEKIIQIDAQLPGVLRVERVFHVDECGEPTAFLGLRDHRQCERGLARGFGSETSTTRPRGNPPTPSARSIKIFPVGMTSMSTILSSPRRMIAPSP